MDLGDRRDVEPALDLLRATVRRATGFLATAFLAGLRLATIFFAGFFATDFLATAFLAGLRLATVFFAAGFFVLERLTVLRALVFLFTVLRALDSLRRALEDFFAAGFRAVDFLAGVFNPSSCAAFICRHQKGRVK